ncbi:MAG: hypothetical protein WAT12_06205 [Candidatus Nitrotoga sp.]
MIHKAEFWAAYVNAVRLEAAPVSEYAKQRGFVVKPLVLLAAQAGDSQKKYSIGELRCQAKAYA